MKHPNHNYQNHNNNNNNNNNNNHSSSSGSNSEYEADDADGAIQTRGKSGWCFIGEDRGYRSCAMVGVNDKCMSGDIFPSKQICVNPNLRH